MQSKKLVTKSDGSSQEFSEAKLRARVDNLTEGLQQGPGEREKPGVKKQTPHKNRLFDFDEESSAKDFDVSDCVIL